MTKITTEDLSKLDERLPAKSGDYYQCFSKDELDYVWQNVPFEPGQKVLLNERYLTVIVVN